MKRKQKLQKMLPEIEDRIKTVNIERKTSWQLRVHFRTLRRTAEVGELRAAKRSQRAEEIAVAETQSRLQRAICKQTATADCGLRTAVCKRRQPEIYLSISETLAERQARL